MLICFYGINTIGKSTQAKKLEEALCARAYDAEYIKFPDYSLEPSGPILHQELRGGAQSMSEKELQLWFVLNRYQKMKTLNPEKIWILEDYIGTALAWGQAKGLSLEWLESINDGLPQEDLAIFLDGTPRKEAFEQDHIHENNEALMLASQQFHRELAQKKGWIPVERESIEDTHAKILSLTLPYLPPHL